MAVMKGGYVGNEPIQALYRGSELLWSSKPDYPDYYVMAEDSDFEPILGKTGRFRYVGTKRYIILPEKIQGEDFILAEMFDGAFILGVAGRASRSGRAWRAFANTTSLLLELKYLDTSNITSMQAMFSETSAKEIQVSFFDTSNVTNMSFMFSRAENLTSLDVSSFDTSNVTTMRAMFQSLKSFSGELDLSSFNTENVNSMRFMFFGNSASSIKMPSFNTKQVVDMESMFGNTKNLNVIDLSSFNLSASSDLITQNMFRGSGATVGYARTKADANILNGTTNKPDDLIFKVSPPSYYKLATDSDFRRMDTGRYRYTGSKDYIVLPETIHGEKFELDGMFEYTSIKGVAGKPSKSGSAESAFRNTKSTTLELLYLDTSNVINMRTMFYNSQATTLDLSSFDTSNVTDMSDMFGDSQATTLDLSSFDTSNVTNMESMFYGSLATVLDLSSFDTSNVVEDMGMFFNVQAKVGYARTQADADRLNDSWYKPDHLTFVVKSD